MEVRVEAGNCVDFPNMHGARVGDRLKLVDRQITELPLNCFQVLKNAVRVVRS